MIRKGEMIRLLTQQSFEVETLAQFCCAPPGDECVQFTKPPVRVTVRPVMHTNEIEVQLEIFCGNWRAFSRDVVQAWLGEMRGAFMFSEGTASAVVRRVLVFASYLLEQVSRDPESAQRALERTEETLSDEFFDGRLREEAESAWRDKRYKEAVDLYMKLEPRLSQLERKRLRLSRRLCR